MKKERQLNFEVLRIISMFLIVIFHYSDWGGLIHIENSTANRLLGDFINIGGRLGVNLFILISGYFLIESKFKVKKLLKLGFEILFYSVFLTIIALVFKMNNIGVKQIIKAFLPISYNFYWFATTYIVMYILSPFINKLVNNISKEQHKILLIILLVITSAIPTILINSNIATSNLMWFICMYVVSAYIRKYDIQSFKTNKTYLIISIILVIAMFGISVFSFEIKNYIPFVKKLEIYFNRMNMLPMLMLSISIFMYFKNKEIYKGRKIISILASSSFAVYLIHIHPSIRGYLFNNILNIKSYYETNTIILFLYIISTAILIYVTSVLIDFIRKKILEEPIFRIKKFDKYFDKIDKIMDI